MTETFRFFNENEIRGLSHDLVFKLDRVREFYGFPIFITSGFRLSDKNDSVGGVKDSEHLTGEGVDISAPRDTFLREKLAWAIGVAGFHRVGSYPRHFHCGISKKHPNPSFWIGEYKS